MFEMSLVKVFLSAILEIFSIAFRAISLGFRLLANISAGHVIFDLANAIRYKVTVFASSTSDMLVFSRIIFLQVYESFVSTVQLGVFWSLLAVYAD